MSNWGRCDPANQSKTKDQAAVGASRVCPGVTSRRGVWVTPLASLTAGTFLASRNGEPLNLAMGNLLEFGFPPLARTGDQEENQAIYDVLMLVVLMLHAQDQTIFEIMQLEAGPVGG